MENCRHIWVSSDEDENGEAMFSKSPFGPEPVTHVCCSECNARTWLTKEQWFALEEDV